ncbi:NAD(P)-binding protein [Zopfia rhizophila CBS 207.26]|uniref:NAD(P)-binding protein n=1 Tax=Zopfia rhizophila CBS 207.26 TaxID=1314779 RepID=A0A6A6DX35_9PEZI|nr:NAD(P)-binding protein [Zopfia rhizophila CBS 207.26]
MADQKKYTTKLVNSRVLIIGGSSGMGYGVAEACLESGAIVTISSSNPTRVNTSVESLRKSYPSASSNVHGLVVDLSKPETLESEIEKLFKETAKSMEGRKLDHVIFTAADALSMMPLSEMTMPKILQVGQIRFFAPLMVGKYCAQYLVSSPKSSYTITTGSVSERPVPNWSVVGSYAGGHHSMVRNLALDMKPIRVNGISPGVVDTDMWQMGEEEKKAFFKQCEERMATGVAGRPEDVVESFLAVLKDCNMDGAVARTDGVL